MSQSLIYIAVPIEDAGERIAAMGVTVRGRTQYWTGVDFKPWSDDRKQAARVPFMESPSAIKAEVAGARLQPGYMCGFIEVAA